MSQNIILRSRKQERHIFSKQLQYKIMWKFNNGKVKKKKSQDISWKLAQYSLTLGMGKQRPIIQENCPMFYSNYQRLKSRKTPSIHLSGLTYRCGFIPFRFQSDQGTVIRRNESECLDSNSGSTAHWKWLLPNLSKLKLQFPYRHHSKDNHAHVTGLFRGLNVTIHVKKSIQCQAHNNTS